MSRTELSGAESSGAKGCCSLILSDRAEINPCDRLLIDFFPLQAFNFEPAKRSVIVHPECPHPNQLPCLLEVIKEHFLCNGFIKNVERD